MDNKKSFVVYTEWLDLIDTLEVDEQLAIFRRIFEYERGTDVSAPGSRTLEGIWRFIKRKLDENEKAKERRLEGNRKGGKSTQVKLSQLKSTEVNSSQPRHNVNVNVNENVNVNDNGNVNVIGDSKGELRSQTKRFVPPSLGDIEDYITEMGYTVKSLEFFDYYEARGWKLGKNSMKDWKAAVRTWQYRENQRVNENQGTINSFLDVE